MHLKLNSNTFSFTRSTQEYAALEKIANKFAMDARCTDVISVNIKKVSTLNSAFCVFKTAESMAPVMPGTQTSTGETDPGTPTQPMSPTDAQEVKGNAVVNYIQDNNIPVTDKNSIQQVVDTVNSTQLSPDQLTQMNTNNDHGIIQQISQALSK